MSILKKIKRMPMGSQSDSWIPDSTIHLEKLSEVKELLKDETSDTENKKTQFYKLLFSNKFKLENEDEGSLETCELDSSEPLAKIPKLETSMNDTSTFSNSVTDVSLKEKMLQSLTLGDIDSSLLSDLRDAPKEDGAQICKYLVKRIPYQDNFVNLCSFILKNSEDLEFLMEQLICPKIIGEMAMHQELLGVLIQLQTEKCEEIICKALLVPLMSKVLLEPEQTILNYLLLATSQIKNVKNVKKILLEMLSHNQLILNESLLPVLDNLLQNAQIFELSDHEMIIVSLAQTLAKSSAAQSKNAKFGKFLLNTLKKLPQTTPIQSRSFFIQAIDSHATFLKKAAENELKKRKFI